MGWGDYIAFGFGSFLARPHVTASLEIDLCIAHAAQDNPYGEPRWQIDIRKAVHLGRVRFALVLELNETALARGIDQWSKGLMLWSVLAHRRRGANAGQGSGSAIIP